VELITTQSWPVFVKADSIQTPLKDAYVTFSSAVFSRAPVSTWAMLCVARHRVCLNAICPLWSGTLTRRLNTSSKNTLPSISCITEINAITNYQEIVPKLWSHRITGVRRNLSIGWAFLCVLLDRQCECVDKVLWTSPTRDVRQTGRRRVSLYKQIADYFTWRSCDADCLTRDIESCRNVFSTSSIVVLYSKHCSRLYLTVDITQQ